MPSTVRIAIALTTPETGSNDNVDAIVQGQYGRRQRWSVPPASVNLQFDWPPTPELHVFFQVWQLANTFGDSNFKISYPGETGWGCVIPPVGTAFFMLHKPDIGGVIFVDSQNAVEMDVVFF